jgi:hypothetical protein
MNEQKVHVFPGQNKKVIVSINTTPLSPARIVIDILEINKTKLFSDTTLTFSIEQEDIPSVEDCEYYYHTINIGLSKCGISVLSSFWIFLANRIPRKIADKLAKEILS